MARLLPETLHRKFQSSGWLLLIVLLLVSAVTMQQACNQTAEQLADHQPLRLSRQRYAFCVDVKASRQGCLKSATAETSVQADTLLNRKQLECLAAEYKIYGNEPIKLILDLNAACRTSETAEELNLTKCPIFAGCLPGSVLLPFRNSPDVANQLRSETLLK